MAVHIHLRDLVQSCWFVMPFLSFFLPSFLPWVLLFFWIGTKFFQRKKIKKDVLLLPWRSSVQQGIRPRNWSAVGFLWISGWVGQCRASLLRRLAQLGFFFQIAEWLMVCLRSKVSCFSFFSFLPNLKKSSRVLFSSWRPFLTFKRAVKRMLSVLILEWVLLARPLQFCSFPFSKETGRGRQRPGMLQFPSEICS